MFWFWLFWSMVTGYLVGTGGSDFKFMRKLRGGIWSKHWGGHYWHRNVIKPNEQFMYKHWQSEGVLIEDYYHSPN